MRKQPVIAFKAFISVIFITMVTGVLLFNGSQKFADRVNQSLNIFQLNYSGINDASSNRLPIWKTGLKIVEANPVLGVGPRGFRDIYNQYASSGDYFITHSPKYPHQLYLEVAVESGLLGLVSLLIAVFLMARNGMLSLKNDPNPGLIASGFSVLAIYFPLNTHPAIYSADFALLVWWLTGLYYGCSNLKNDR
jgi:O-antigen ligase